jgi:hypothetical protein
MTRSTLERARDLAGEHLFALPDPEGILARREAGRPDPQDERRLAVLLDALGRAQHADGSWEGGLIPTATTLLLLRELFPDGDPAGVVAGAAVDFLRARRGAPGRYGDRCTPVDHAAGLCHHFLGGFFAAAPAGAPLPEVVLPSRARVQRDPDTRLAASALALEAVLRWGILDRDTAIHLEGIRHMLRLADRLDDDRLVPAARVAALAALLAAPATTDGAAVAGVAIGMILRTQRADGSWPGTDAFQVLELLRAAGAPAQGGHACHNAGIDAAIARAAEMLALTQQRDGTWDRGAGPRRTLIGWRTLRHATRAAGTTPAGEP